MKPIQLFILAACTLSAASRSPAATRFVNLANPAPASPYTTWPAAATNIQDAVDASTNGDLILVTNGVYQTGSRLTSDGTQNRIVVTNSITLQAVNGPSLTTINGLNATRCVYLSNTVVLAGFTLTSGNAIDGAGVFCASGNELVLNCVLSYNLASRNGGGANGGTLTNCTLISNSVSSYPHAWSASGGGAYVATLTNCTLTGNSAQYGGGTYDCTANNCTLSNNSANGTSGFTYGFGGGDWGSTLNHCTLSANSANGVPGFYGNGYGGGSAYSTLNSCTLSGNSSTGNAATGNYGPGGGAYGATLNNCTLTGNSATGTGGGAYNSTLNNCTVSGNSTVTHNYPGSGAGVYGGALKNCIVVHNATPGYPDDNFIGSTLNYCCTTPLPSAGSGNITDEPLFVDLSGGNLRLQAGSPCINSGHNAYAPGPTDLDGNPRISGGTVDIGAYEFQHPASVISYAWLISYGLPTDGSADFADPDGDGMNNWQEWVAGTNPTDAASVLKMLSANPGATNVIVTWSSVSTRSYSLARATNLLPVPAFSVVWSNIAGLAGTTSFTDTNPPAGPTAFYRVTVRPP